MKTVLIINDKQDFFDLLNEWEQSKPLKKDGNRDQISQKEFINQREAARFLGVCLPTIIAWKKENKIPYYQQGRTVLYNKTELLEAMKKGI